MPGESLRILLIDDDEEDRFLVRSLLQEGLPDQAVSVEEEATFERGLARIVEGRFDLAFLDYRLGEEDALALLSQAGAKGVTTPVVVLTGRGSEEVAVEAMKLGAVDYLVKSKLDRLGLAACIHRALDAARQRARLDLAKAALRESEERLRTLIEAVPDGLLVVNVEGSIVLGNAQAGVMFDYSREELLGRPMEMLLPDRFREAHVGHRLRYRAEPRMRAMGVGLDLLARRKDGSEFPVEVSLSPIRTGPELLVVVAIRDVTERKRMEKELRASEARYQDLYENAPDMFVSVDAATARILQCNQTLATATGYSKEEIVGRPVFEMYHPDCLEEARRAFRDFVETGEVRDRELQLKRKDGSRIHVSLNVRAIRDAEGRILHSMSTWRDITERKHREELQRRSEEMEEQNRRIQEANRLKSEFLANMSHELRTPLNAILGFAQLMHDGKVGAVSDQHREYLGDILTSGRHLLQLVNDVLDLAKVESGKLEFLPEPVELPKLVGEVRDILRTLAAEKRIFVETQVDPTLTDVVADPRRLKQILYNYLSNALKFTPDGGQATVRVAPEGPEALRLEVEDTGVGISPEDLGRLFVEFQQLDTGVAKRHPGTGLGLALTRRIVEAQGGHVGVRSTPGTGSVFFAVLPRRPRGAALESKGIAARPRTAAPLVLVIEDDAKDRAWLEATLNGADYAVESARTGGEALARCRDTAYDAIVLDILLPDMSGWDALRAIRAAGLNRDTPTIVVTVVAEKGKGAGFFIHDYLEKPIQAQDLLASLTRAGVPPSLVRPILVVEDDPADRRIMEALLSQLGYRPLVRPDGASGLQAAAEDPPAAVILDLLMPGMDGFQFLERFRRTGIGRRTPVIVWTAHDLTTEVLSRLRASAQAVVQKSSGAEALLEELRAHVLPPRAAGDAGSQRK
jgi:PAS domain S-box-containing protein